MRNIIVAFLLICPILLFAQKKRENIISERVGPLYVDYIRSIDMDKGDTLLYFYLGFQNAKYSSITDIKSVFITQKDVYQSFMKDLLSAHKVLAAGEKTNIDWDRSPNYKMNIYDFSKSNPYLQEGKGTGGYTVLSKGILINLIETMSQIDFGNTVLLPKKSISDFQ